MAVRQLDLFERSSLNVSSEVKRAMNEAARASELSRAQIVDRMNALGRRFGVTLRLSVPTFEKWLNPRSDLDPSIKALVIFSAVLDCREPITELIRPLGFRVIGEEEINLLEWARANMAVKQARQKMKRLESEMH